MQLIDRRRGMQSDGPGQPYLDLIAGYSAASESPSTDRETSGWT